jgi:hypothetical protein
MRTMNSAAVAQASELISSGDAKRGVAVLQQASNAGDLDASFALGVVLQKGIGAAPSTAAALEVWKRGAAAGSTGSMVALADLYFRGDGVRSDRSWGVELCEQAGNSGEPQGFLNLGQVFDQGLYGLKEDPESAATYYKRAADLGDGTAMFFLARMFMNGRGVARDVDAAFRYTELSAETNDPDGLTALAFLCFTGHEGYPEDQQRAEKLYRIAAKLGQPAARETLKSLPPIVNLGTIVCSAGAARLGESDLMELINRHRSGVWGDVDADQWEKSDRAVAEGGRVLSLHRSEALTILVSTETNRSSTYIEILGEQPEKQYDFWTGIERASKLISVVKFLSRFS